jgi:two-component system, NarL family, response regulator LiaR
MVSFMRTDQVRVLVVEDLKEWRSWICSALHKDGRMEVASEASDGLQALKSADSIEPDLILLDISLPSLNGIDVGRRLVKLCPKAKVLFISENRDVDIVQEALSIGAIGYVLKSDLAEDLSRALTAVLDGRTFISRTVSHELNLAYVSAPNNQMKPRHYLTQA